jgi:multiple sugar transport system substrate-binding protein
MEESGQSYNTRRRKYMATSNNLFKRLSLFGLVAILMGVLLGACGDNTNTPGTAATTAAAPATTAAGAATTAATGATTAAGAATTAAGAGAATLAPDTSVTGEVRLATATSSPEEDKIVETQIQNFQKAYPNVKVNREIIASDYDTKVKTLISGGNAPDVFYVDSLIGLDYIEDKVLEPLNGYFDKFKVKSDDFYPSLIKAYTGADGKVYGLPKDHNTLAMFYNKDLLQQAGVTSPPKTWDELRDAATKLKAKLPADSVAIAAEPDLARVLPFVYQAGGAMVSEDRKSSKVTEAGFKRGLEFYYNLRKDGLSKKASELGAEWPGDALIKGKAAIVFEGGWLIPPATKAGIMSKVGIAELPKGETQATMDFTVAYVMSSKAKSKDAAFALLSFLTSESQQKLLSDSGLALPSRKSLTGPFVEKFPERKPLVDGTNYARPWQFGVGFGGFADKVNPVLQGVFSGNKTIDQAVTEIDKLVKDRL